MNTKKIIPVISVIVALVVLCGALVLCDSVSEKAEEKTNLFYHYYGIEPESLLDSLEAGNVNVFSPINEAPLSIPPDQQITVPWTQDDYLLIVDALNEFVWGETLEGWRLNSMDFALGCGKVSIGLQEGNFEFFKIEKLDERESRLQLIINVYPRGKYIFMTENEYYPKLTDWSSIDFGRNQLSASDVLQIAENAGGQEKRSLVDNACNISIWLSPDSASYRGWVVRYYRRDNDTTLFQVNIDPVTGDIR